MRHLVAERPMRRTGRVPALVVVLLHGGLLLAWLSTPTPRPPAPLPPAAIVWLQPPAAPTPPPRPVRRPPAAAPDARAAPEPTRVPVQRPARRAPVEPEAITLPLPLQPAPASSPSVAVPPAGPADPASSPLQLALPPGSWAEPTSPAARALNDPRANSGHRPGTALSRLGERGPGLSEQAMAGQGRRRVTIDGACVEVHEARIQQIDPFNRSNSPLPAQVKSCD
jgi:hypothetical protein